MIHWCSFLASILVCFCRLSLDKSAVVAPEGITVEEVLLMAALSARWENADAIDTALTSAVADPESKHQYKISRMIPFSPVDKRTTAYCTGPDGKDFVTTKGAPQVSTGHNHCLLSSLFATCI